MITLLNLYLVLPRIMDMSKNKGRVEVRGFI